jgi:tetratricopeptide (TPR) repeat protein
MALDREKTFSNAERLMKQGKTALALDECKRLAEDAPRDLLMLNRLGDFLARSNRGADAIVYYEMIAEQFSASGFYPKAIAILKKIVKVDPGHVSAVVKLGELNLKQKLPGEARAWLLQAADEYLRRREFAKAREVYEKLVVAEPDHVTHAVRLAETRAAEGDSARAGIELIALGGRLLAGRRLEDAERTFKRASELLPGRAEPVVGLARCQEAAGKMDEAKRLADEAWGHGERADAVAGDLFLLFERLGDTERSARLLLDPKSDGIADDAIDQAFRLALASGGTDALWSRVVPLLDRWIRARQFDRAGSVLERIARTEDGGHARALEQLVELRKAEGNRGVIARTVERLIRAYQAKGMTDKLAPQFETLKQFDPTSPLLFVGRASHDAPPRSETAPASAPPAANVPAASAAYATPAVPLTPADTEWVSGNLTEAEVFEKYGLHREALQQLRQITSRFPGHVASQEKLVGFLRTQADRGALRDGLVSLGLAKRASGDVEGARRAVTEASTLGSLEGPVRAALEGFALLPPPAAPASPPKTAPPKAESPKAVPPKAEPPKAVPPKAVPPKASPTKTTPAAPSAAASKPAPAPAPAPAADPPRRPASPAAATPSPVADDELEIVFEDIEDLPEPVGASASDAVEEIEFYLGQGMTLDALNRIAEARAAGVAGSVLDPLEARARSAAPGGAVGAEDTDSVVDLVPEELESGESGDRLDEEDLSSITAALDAEYGTDRVPEEAEAPPEPESEDSVDDVFASFKEHVKDAVEVGDFQTHYDLGIAYKEMGLTDAALDEFRIATGAPALYREACTMLGICHWERGDAAESIRWYRAALDAPGGDAVRLTGIRYDLAERLEQTGDLQGAYEHMAKVLREEPGYRDVKLRIAALRSKLGL